MNNLGLGAMIHYLSGGSENSADKYYGRKIKTASLVDNKLVIEFTGKHETGKIIHVYDNGQSCCESRYMTTDDNLSDLRGGKLTEIKLKYAEDETGEYGDVHEICFLEVSTDKGSVVFANHNEHNGYYGGFGLTIVEQA